MNAEKDIIFNIEQEVAQKPKGKDETIEERPFLPMLQSKETSIANSFYIERDSNQLSFNFNNNATIERGGVKFYLNGFKNKAITASTQKLLKCLHLELTKSITFRGEVSDNVRVGIDIKDYIKLVGKDPDNKKTRDNYREIIKRGLDTLALLEVSITDEQGREIKVPLQGGIRISKPVNGVCLFTISKDYARMLSKSFITYIPRKYFLLPENKNPIPTYLYDKLAQHYCINRNEKRGTNNILKVETVLEYLQDLLPSYDEVQKSNRDYWGRIIRPVKEALNELQKTGLITWSWCWEKKRKPTPAEARILGNDYNLTRTAYITYELTDANLLEQIKQERKQGRWKELDATEANDDPAEKENT